MSYNTSTTPRQDNSAPVPFTPTSTYFPTTTYSPSAPRSTKPVYNNTSNTYAAPTYISSPFDDNPIPPPANSNNNNNNSLEKSPYDDSYNPHYNQDHNTSMTEKGLAGGGGGGGGGGEPAEQTHAVHLSNQQNNPYSSQRDPYNNQNNFSSDSHHHQRNDNPNYYNGYDEDRPSLSNDTAPMRPYADMETSEGLTRSKSGVTRVKYGKKKSCLHSTCGRVTCCCCLILLLGIIALAIVIFTMFKLPTVKYLDMEAEPQFTFNQGETMLAVSLVANIEVTNPNPIGFNFEAITATAYYPNYSPTIGGGNLNHVDFPSKSSKIIHFPISARYSGSQDNGYVVVRDILNRCGVLGGEKTKLTINYDLQLTFKIIFFNISPTIKNQHVDLDCPANVQDIANNIGGVESFIRGGGGGGAATR
ncbi:hypothetical protein BGZ65_008792, partial [Modicella reniformis]